MKTRRTQRGVAANCRWATATALMMTIMTVACVSAAAQTGAAFLKIGVGARYEALGGASAALRGEPAAMNSNIAGLLGVAGTEITFMHNSYMMDMTQEYMAAGVALGPAAAAGLSLIRMDAGKMPGYSADNQPTGSFSARDTAVSVGYARAVGSALSAGAALKYIRSEIGRDAADSFAVDLGVIWDRADDPWTIGLSITNIGPGIKFIDEKDPLPSTLSVGAAYRFRGRPLLIVSQISLPRSDDAVFHLGAEYALADSLDLRVGYNSSSDLDNGFAFGLGFGMQRYRIDYGFVPLGVFGDSHRVSFSVNF